MLPGAGVSPTSVPLSLCRAAEDDALTFGRLPWPESLCHTPVTGSKLRCHVMGPRAAECRCCSSGPGGDKHEDTSQGEEPRRLAAAALPSPVRCISKCSAPPLLEEELPIARILAASAFAPEPSVSPSPPLCSRDSDLRSAVTMAAAAPQHEHDCAASAAQGQDGQVVGATALQSGRLRLRYRRRPRSIASMSARRLGSMFTMRPPGKNRSSRRSYQLFRVTDPCLVATHRTSTEAVCVGHHLPTHVVSGEPHRIASHT